MLSIYLYKLACIFLLLYNQVKIALKNGFFLSETFGVSFICLHCEWKRPQFLSIGSGGCIMWVRLGGMRISNNASIQIVQTAPKKEKEKQKRTPSRLFKNDFSGCERKGFHFDYDYQSFCPFILRGCIFGERFFFFVFFFEPWISPFSFSCVNRTERVL